MSVTRAETQARSWSYVPGLDGLRAVAIVAVLFFHHGYGWSKGGFLGVSLFFTLSGYLITRGLLREHDTTGTISLRGFFGRRMRRLLPPALLTVVAASLGAVAGLWNVAGLRGDLLSAVLYVANWRFLVDGASYQRLFEVPSPVLHFWSLAIEEQFYLVVAPAVLLAMRWRRGRGLVPATAMAGGLALVVAIAAAWVGNRDFIYYASPTRSFELLTGVGVAVLLHRGGVARDGLCRLARFGAGPVLAVLVASMVLVDRSNPLVYRGLLPVFAVGSAIVVLGVAVGSHVDGVLSLRPLVALGRISYGVYLFHWPLFLALTPDRTGLSGTSLFALRVGLSVLAAAISHATLERRVRFNWRASEGAAVAWGGLATAAVVVVVMAASAPITAGGGGSLASGPGDWEQRISSAVPASSAQPRLRIAMYGDSTALRTGIGLTAWAETTGQLAVLPGVVELGCGLVAEGEYQFADEPPYPVPGRCDWRTSWSVNIEQSRPDVAVVQIGPWEVTDRRLPHDKVWRHPGDATYDRYLAAQIAAAADLFADRGVPVVWLTSPRIDVGRLTGSGPQATSDPTRMDRLNALIRESVGQRGDVTIVDLAGYLASQPGGELDERLRPDGVHFTEATAAEVATWLAPAILAAA